MGGQVQSDGLCGFFMVTFQEGEKKIFISLQLQLKSPAHMQAIDSPGREGGCT